MTKNATPRGLTREQLHHVHARMHDICEKRKALIRAKYTTKLPEMTVDQLLLAVAKGKLKVHPHIRGTDPVTGSWSLATLFGVDAFPNPVRYDVKAAEPEMRELTDEYQRAMDAIVLGGAPEALAALRQFAGE